MVNLFKRNKQQKNPQNKNSNDQDHQEASSSRPEDLLVTATSKNITDLKRSRMILKDVWVQPNLFSGSKGGKRVALYDTLILYAGILLGILCSGAIIGLGFYDWLKSSHKYCLVLDEDFNGPLNTNLWKHDIQVGGFGNGEFEWTTSSPNNSYTKDGYLYITPTLTSDMIGEAALLNGYTVNLTDTKTCTAEPVPWVDRSQSLNIKEMSIGNADTNCQIRSNNTLGTIIPPIQSARLITNGTFSMKYGKVEVRAKMPKGDWLWPAVWMMPRDSVYGVWPQSGEIDIFEGKGNMPTKRSQQLANTMASALHFGTDSSTDQFYRFRGVSTLWRKFWNEDYYTFGLEWDENGLYTWRDSPAHKVLIVKFDTPTVQRMPLINYKGTGFMTPGPNPWSTSNSTAAPFDQDFFLILNVAVGGTNGYFADVGQPWSNGDPNAALTFWGQRASWLPSWGDAEQRSMKIDYVKAWKQC